MKKKLITTLIIMVIATSIFTGADVHADGVRFPIIPAMETKPLSTAVTYTAGHRPPIFPSYTDFTHENIIVN